MFVRVRGQVVCFCKPYPSRKAKLYIIAIFLYLYHLTNISKDSTASVMEVGEITEVEVVVAAVDIM